MNTIVPMDLIRHIQGIPPSNNKIHILLICIVGEFSRIDYMLGQKTSLNKSKKIETISSIFPHNHVMKLEINSRKSRKLTRM